MHACEDGDFCTVGTACKSGVCQGGSPRSCDDGEPCTSDSCDSKAGACAFASDKADGAPCGDSAACQKQGSCLKGQCVGGVARPWSQADFGFIADCGDLIGGDNGGWLLFGRKKNAATGVLEPAVFDVRYTGKIRKVMLANQSKGGMFWNGTRLADGTIWAVGETLAGAAGGKDGLFAKIPAGVTEITDRHAIGGFEDDRLDVALAASDAGAFLVGTTRSKGQGGAEGWVVRVDKRGEQLWEQTYGAPVRARSTSR